MYIDYLTLMLINMAAGLALLACYVCLDFDGGNSKRWVPGFAIVGFLALITGLHMTFTWPLPGAYNVAFGEMSVLLGVLFLAAALAFAKDWDLLSLAIYAFFAGLAAFVIGVRIIGLGMTLKPWFSGIGFILTGLAGVFALPALYLRSRRSVRLLGTIVLATAAFIWAITGYTAYRGHLSKDSNPGQWVPYSSQGR